MRISPFISSTPETPISTTHLWIDETLVHNNTLRLSASKEVVIIEETPTEQYTSLVSLFINNSLTWNNVDVHTIEYAEIGSGRIRRFGDTQALIDYLYSIIVPA